MSSKSMLRAWAFGLLLSVSVALATCNGPVPVVANNPGRGGSSGSGGGGSSGSSTDDGSGTGAQIDLNPGATSTSVATNTEITEKDNCGITSNDATKQADILLVLDRSSSMNNAMDSDSPCNGGIGGGRRDASAGTCQSRWTVVQAALKQVLTSSADSVSWGLLLFSSPGQGSCVVADKIQVDVGVGNAAEISTQISNAGTATSTPTRKAVNVGVKYLQGLKGPESKSILLATDGQPNCVNDSGSTGDDVGPTADAIKAAASAGYKVYILGIGPEASATALNRFAKEGGTEIENVSGPGKNYFAALSAEELVKHFDSIVSTVASCTFSLKSAPPVPDNIAVEFDGVRGKRAPRSSSDGWEYTSGDHKTIQLYGSWCDGLMNGTYKTAKVLFGCGTYPIP